jgi:O-antigen biosynthesis protein
MVRPVNVVSMSETTGPGGRVAPTVSIVVPILETAAVLDLFLSGLHDTVPDNVQLILVNDGCGPESSEVIDRWRKTFARRVDVSVVTHSRPLGDGFAFNAGATRAEGQFIVRLDSDLMFPNPWLDGLLAVFDQDEQSAIVSGVLLYPQSGGVNHAGLTFYRFGSRHVFLNARTDALPTDPFAVQTSGLGFSIIRRDMFQAAGGFDSVYQSGYDDLDFALRVRDLGGSTIVTPHATAFHWERSAGPYRDAGRKRNLAVFWHRWGNRIVDDLEVFLVPALRRCLASEGGQRSPILGIDLCGDRRGAEQLWRDLTTWSSVSLDDVHSLCHRAPADGPIALPLVFGSDGPREPRQMLFLTDNFVRLRGNSYFFERRFVHRSDDIVIDLHGNAMYVKELAQVSWPGDKMR